MRGILTVEQLPMSECRPTSSDRIVLFQAWPQFDALELSFWRRLRDGLALRGLRLVLTSTSTPPVDLGLAHVPAVPSIDAVWCAGTAEWFRCPVDTLGLDAEALLAREAQWGAPAVLPTIEVYRRRAIEATAAWWLGTLATLDPVAVVLWNGQHVSEVILDAAARQGGLPVLYVERAPIPQALFADARGLSAASDIARRPEWPEPEPRWHECAASLIRRIAGGQDTWWEQPASHRNATTPLRKQLGIPRDARVLLFAGQVDEDTQQFLFSPLFSHNVEAFRWLLQHLRGRSNVFVLGKQHPKSRTAVEAYHRALAESGVPGQWRVDLSIDDALAVADRVAAVNSTVLYEAMAREIPVLSLGDWLLGGRGAAYEVRGHGDTAAIDAWVEAADIEARQQSWRRGLAVLLSSCIYAYAPGDQARGMLGASDLANRLDRLADRSHRWRMPEAAREAWLLAREHGALAWRLPDDPREPNPSPEWQRAHTLRFQLLEAARAAKEGRRVLIWGTGEGGRLTTALLEGSGVTVAAVVDSTPNGAQAHGRPLISPDALLSGDFVLVASTAAPTIIPALTALGFTQPRDFFVLDCDYLPAVWFSVEGRGGWSPSNP
jgi:hypothetical protein